MKNDTKYEKTINFNDIYYDKEGYVQDKLGLIKEKVICLRPAHKSGIPQIYAEEKYGKIISHNYCHSGNGYSLLFGTVDLSIENFLEIATKKGFSENKNEDITIVGLGCIGLTTAIKLYEKGYKNIKLVGENFYNTPSFWAGGLIDLFSIDDKSVLEKMNKLFKNSFEQYEEIFKGNHRYIKNGIKKMDYYVDVYPENVGVSYLANIGKIPQPKKINLQLINNKNESLKSSPFEVFNFQTFHVVTHTFMEENLKTLKNLNIPILFKKIESFEEIKSKIIFNCSGLGSFKLNNDKGVYPICGHGYILSNEVLSDNNYMLYLSQISEFKGTEYEGSIYFMPKLSGFIGGTYMKDYYGDDEKLNNDIINKLVSRGKFVFNNILPVEVKMKPKY